MRTEEDKIAEARAAMEEYMNRDDGGDDWLSMLGDIMEEEEEQLIIPEFGEMQEDTRASSGVANQQQEEPNQDPFQ